MLYANVEQQHLQQLALARQIQSWPLQPQQHGSPMHQSPSTRNASVTQPRTGLTPQSLVQPQTPAVHVHSSAGATPTSASSTPHSTNVGTVPLTSGSPMTPIMPASADPGIVPQLQNVVSTVNLGCKLDLRMIALHACNTEYNPKRFAAVVMRIREPRTTALIFSSGKMVCTGAKSEEQSRLASRKYARIIQKLGFEAKFLDFRVQNMVASGDVRFAINLEALAVAHRRFSSYEPELSHSIIFNMVKPRIVLLISVSGKVTLTGAKTRSQIYEAFDNINTILKAYRKQ